MSSTLIPIHWAIGLILSLLIIIAFLVLAIWMQHKDRSDTEQEAYLDREDLREEVHILKRHRDEARRLFNEESKAHGELERSVEMMAENGWRFVRQNGDWAIARGLCVIVERGGTPLGALTSAIAREAIMEKRDQAAS